MKDLTTEIAKVKELLRGYENISQQQDHNKRNVIDAYINWHSAALVLFDSYGIPPEDPYLKNFVSVNNRGNGYVLYDNFKSIKSSFDVLINRIENMEVSSISSNKVFIVHGHDNVMKLEVANYISSELKLQPIILNDCPNKGKTVIEKFEEYSKDVCFAIVLLSPDDVGGINKDDLKGRARQNVIFEFGYFVSKLGREKVCALCKDEIEKPSDINGVLYIPFNNNWKFNLLKELKIAGIPV